LSSFGEKDEEECRKELSLRSSEMPAGARISTSATDIFVLREDIFLSIFLSLHLLFSSYQNTRDQIERVCKVHFEIEYSPIRELRMASARSNQRAILKSYWIFAAFYLASAYLAISKADRKDPRRDVFPRAILENQWKKEREGGREEGRREKEEKKASSLEIK